MASSCHVSVKPKKSIEEVRRLKMCKDLFLENFNKSISCKPLIESDNGEI